MRVCSVEGCDRPVYGHGMCNAHWQRQRKGKPLGPLRPRSRKVSSVCAVEGCERRLDGHGLCRLHLDRMRKTGTTDPPKRAPAACIVEGCERAPSTTVGFCPMHQYRVRKNGEPLTVKPKGSKLGPRKAVVGYKAAHYRVRSARGPAREYPCSECGGQAVEWAYNHLDPDQLEELVEWGDGRVTNAPYSVNPEFYRAMCRRCHRVFDAAR